LHDGVKLGHKTVVGAGAIVTKSCEPRSVFIPTKTESRIMDRVII
jgi:tetrahydrodipicolinate N-succinyltransferase